MLPPQPTNFGFIGRIWPELLIHCRDAEQAAVSNPRVAGIEARFVLEHVVAGGGQQLHTAGILTIS